VSEIGPGAVGRAPLGGAGFGVAAARALAVRALTVRTVAVRTLGLLGATAVRAAAAENSVPPGAGVCALGGASGSEAIDVTLTAPAGAKKVVLAAVARMQAPSGDGPTIMTRTAALRVTGQTTTFSGPAVRVQPSEAVRPGGDGPRRGQPAKIEAVARQPVDVRRAGEAPDGHADMTADRPGEARKAQQARRAGTTGARAVGA
ncbi:hypothetical protein, partial [Nonomuraea zeae]|uniref:hypothetical protein n=1 Tax=Nonomuraea zeae TaxID=1642303 RepID=UPI0014789035